MSHAHLNVDQEFLDVMEKRSLVVLFQPVIDLSNGNIVGYEGQIRGPSDSLLYSPRSLYNTASQAGMLLELENLGCQQALESFVGLDLQGVIFLRLNIDLFLDHKFKEIRAIQLIEKAGLDAQHVVITLYSHYSYSADSVNLLQKIISRFSEIGYQVALEDEGECFAMLQAQPEIHPCCVTINRHLIHEFDRDPDRVHLVKSLLKIASQSGFMTLADGIETQSELLLAKELGIALGRGSFIAGPSKQPIRMPPREVKKLFAVNYGEASGEQSGTEAILERAPSFSLDKCNEEVFEVFEKNPQVSVVAVTNNNIPIGLINRSVFINRYARPYQRELYAKKSCTTFMDPEPLIVDKNISIQDLSRLLSKDQRHVSLGFIFTENGHYLGVGTSQNLIHEITEMQIQSARYANPLTGLPGNAPIDEHIDELLVSEETFCICYLDLDNFKPFNDVYGFSMGDAMIQMSAKIITEEVNPESDFVGHIGGDDFIVLFCSQDWEERCRAILRRFETDVMSFFSPQDVERGGYVTENRRGEKEFHNLASISIGAVPVKPKTFKSHRDVAVIAAESKKLAKKISGNSLFINKRSYA